MTYASTRPFDDPSLLIHTELDAERPGVTINLYQEGTAPDGSQSLTLVDTTKTSSWDDWAQGFRSDNMPNMNCPGTIPSAHQYHVAVTCSSSRCSISRWLDMYNNRRNASSHDSESHAVQVL